MHSFFAHTGKRTSASLVYQGKVIACIFLFLICAALPLQAEDETEQVPSPFSYSYRLIDENEHIDSAHSLLNPSNILQRPDTRVEAGIIGNITYKKFDGAFESEFRLGYHYITGKSPLPFSDESVITQINQLYYQKKLENYSFLIGRKKVRWGVGYCYSPTDLISQLRNPEDPEDRLSLIKGTDIFMLSRINDNGQIDLVYVPETDWSMNNNFIQKSRLGMRWYRFIDPFDLSLVGIVAGEHHWSTGFNTSVTFGKALELHAEYLYTSPNNKRYPIAGINPEEFVYPYFTTHDEKIHDIVLGGQYTFDNNWNLTLEYIYRSAGYSDDEFNAYARHIDYLNSNFRNNVNPVLANAGLQESAYNFSLPLRKHYLFSRLYNSNFWKSFSLDMFSSVSIVDGSGFLVVMPKFEGGKDFEIYLRLKKFWGNNKTEFGLVPDDLSALVGLSLFWGQ